MNSRILNELKNELASRGASQDGAMPNDTMALADIYLSSVELADLFDTMVARREKIFRSIDAVGAEAAKKSYADVVLIIDAIKAVMQKLSLP